MRSFDVLFCSHVLEHVRDDRKAMSEMFRVLKPGGWAVIQVPIATHRTIEDPSITDPRERERLYCQSDHVRLYGLPGQSSAKGSILGPEENSQACYPVRSRSVRVVTRN